MSHGRFNLLLMLAAAATTVVLVVSVSIGAQAPRTVQDGVFTDAQATRGQALYTQRCAGCHGAALTEGQAPPLQGAAFRTKWRREPLSALFIKIRYTMPPNAADADKLPAEQGADLVAHILKTNGFPAGTTAFAAAEATTSTIGWPAAPAGEESAAVGPTYPPAANLNQLMRGVFFPNSNLIFTVQEIDPVKIPPTPASKPEGYTIFETGMMLYTGWPVVEDAALAIADTSSLLLRPGLRCENGRLAPITEPDWIRFTEQMVSVARRTHRLAQTRNQDAVSEFTTDLSNSCNACHRVYRDVGGRGRGGGNTVAGMNAGRCVHR